ncbi:heme exporter protein CcmD [Comamonas sp. Y6]|uniref:Heme exporter protein D n=1 Tax=Comamonas resistens TaxID=3046670 RepID=A0ABY8SSM5_9BURK|nr:heme exporter protein CcmD [Comamonas resistens]MDL5035854.1 heme exporter protein CcmD [Comamonas resistens]WHS65261.1 heme exporter protein CcmD [Comamonas resistens]HBP0978948.1 heme exporter protein CcmD [Pseudomonas aeruginosa]
MNWSSVGEFLAMGGYGVYVWGSVLTTVVLLAAEWRLLGRRRTTALSRIRSEWPAEGARHEAKE